MPRVGAVAVVVLAVGGYSWLAGGTRPFTLAADVLTSLAYLPVGLIAWRAARRAAGSPAAGSPAAGSRSPRIAAWVVATAVAASWELTTYVSGPRRVFPTVSSLYDLAARTEAGKATAFLCWLLLGWALIGR